jgi:hypothetical protein
MTFPGGSISTAIAEIFPLGSICHRVRRRRLPAKSPNGILLPLGRNKHHQHRKDGKRHPGPSDSADGGHCQ